MYIRDGELPEDLLAREKENKNVENNAEPDEMPEEVTKPEKNSNQKPEESEPEYSAEDWYEKYPKPDIMDRFKVHLLDTAVIYIIFSAIYYLFIPGTQFMLSSFIFLYLFAVYINLADYVTWIVLYLTNGFTLGKYLYKHRVIRMDGQKLTLRDVFVRSFLMKGFCDTASCGIMNIVSILVAYARPYSRAVHDIAANTLTIQIQQRKEKIEKIYHFD